MPQSKQDGKASIPPFYRKWIIRTYGEQTMRILDAIGADHDQGIRDLGWSKANTIMRHAMKTVHLPFWGIRLPIGIAIAVYRRLPQRFKNLYPYT